MEANPIEKLKFLKQMKNYYTSIDTSNKHLVNNGKIIMAEKVFYHAPQSLDKDEIGLAEKANENGCIEIEDATQASYLRQQRICKK